MVSVKDNFYDTADYNKHNEWMHLFVTREFVRL